MTRVRTRKNRRRIKRNHHTVRNMIHPNRQPDEVDRDRNHDLGATDRVTGMHFDVFQLERIRNELSKSDIHLFDFGSSPPKRISAMI